MFHKLMTLVIGTSLCLIAREITATECPQNEVLTFLSPTNLPSCGNKGISGRWKFGERCICAHTWFVRNAAGECIPVWMCPDACPPNEEFKYCSGKYQQLMTNDDFTAQQILKLCQPVCSCKEGYVRITKLRKCIWTPLNGKFIGMRG